MLSARARYSTVVAAVLVLPVLTGCSTGDSVIGNDAGAPTEQVVVASGESVEGSVLAEVYATVLASSGVPSRVEELTGGRSDALAALDAARVTLVPEFTGSLLTYYEPQNPARAADDVFEALSRSLPEGLSVADYATAEDRAVVALGRDSASGTQSRTLGAFAPSCAETVAVVSPRFIEDGALEQLAEGADCTFARVEQSAADISDTAATEPTAFGTTTLSPLAQSTAVTVLADPDHILAAQNVVPLFRTGALSDPAVKALSVVAGELSTTDLAAMIDQVRRGQATPSAVARSWWDTRQ
ncbi:MULTISPECIES: glycine betaine ABC transporter substrate-binding protein [Rhodococcus]|uniref:glycine betaine ABC transporter substrate-binding protein n=1 Tax=Rhodococcus TaxID=1827 RepID=UPI00121D0D14|nr:MULTISPECIES: glycine betaine ABC transporter substrate-binding protein [Rhodococcus]MCE4268072.1 ABC transporter substrate-binding protein [Rhodococcus globerulus]RZL21093.1 MAG: ABC transporter substrate-binding protein [Rhodococcus sp. (in: high G+C Gram-positive bacteria)]